MRFIVDAQLPPALAKWLMDQGHNADHVVHHGLQSVPDEEIWDFALKQQAIIITKDQDFARRKTIEGGGPRVVWVRLPNSRRRELIATFERLHAEVVAALERGETLIEVV